MDIRARAGVEGYGRVCQSATAVKTLLVVNVMKWSGKLSCGCNGETLESCVYLHVEDAAGCVEPTNWRLLDMWQ